jgi:hypothetical protein
MREGSCARAHGSWTGLLDEFADGDACAFSLHCLRRFSAEPEKWLTISSRLLLLAAFLPHIRVHSVLFELRFGTFTVGDLPLLRTALHYLRHAWLPLYLYRPRL